jgi:hypothetical protein
MASWSEALHPRGYHGKFGASGTRRSVKDVAPRRKKMKAPSAATAAPRVVFETVQRGDNGKVQKLDKSRAKTAYRAGKSSRGYDYR